MTKDNIINALRQYLLGQVDKIASSNPMIAFTRPLINKVIENKISSISPFLDLLKDANGNINIAEIISEMTTSVMDTKVFNINIPIIGSVLIGDGNIKIPIPYTEQIIVLDKSDIEELKAVLTNN